MIEHRGTGAPKTLMCAVCQEDIRPGEPVKELRCGHVFHNACLKPWLSQHCTCPVCRMEMPPTQAYLKNKELRENSMRTEMDEFGRPVDMLELAEEAERIR